MSWLSSWLSGGPKTQPGQDPASWGHVDPKKIRSGMMQNMDSTVKGLRNLGWMYGARARQSFGQQNQMYRMGKGLMSGDSPILDAMRRQQEEGLGDMAAQQTSSQGRAMAARGMGGGNLSEVLGNKNLNTMGEQARKGYLGIQQYGLQAGQSAVNSAAQFGQLGYQGLQGQGNAIGSVGAIHSQANQAAVGQTQTNAANQASYLQSEGARRRAKQSKRGGLLGGIVGGIGGFVLSGFNPAGAMAGYNLGSAAAS